MNFTDLYRFANSLGTDFVSVEKLRAEVKNHHPTIGDVVSWGCDLDRNVSLAHMILDLERTSAYDDAFIVASIRFDRTLPNDWVRFVCAKELMHVFDGSLEKTSNRERFLRLMDELENNPISVDQSKMFKSERNAEWMAILTLCPLSVRERCLTYRQRDNMTDDEMASRLGIPVGYIKAIFGPLYLPTLERLTGESQVTAKVEQAEGEADGEP